MRYLRFFDRAHDYNLGKIGVKTANSEIYEAKRPDAHRANNN